MATILLDSEYSDELLHINEDPLFEYGSPFAMDDLYPNEQKKDKQNGLLESCRASDCSSEEEEFDFKMSQPHAPPPSPQDTSMLDMLFASKLNSSLDACLNNNSQKKEPSNTAADTQIYNNSLEHAQTLDKLLQRSLNQHQSRGISKKSHKRSTSWQHPQDQPHSIPWQARAKNQKLLHIAKATEQAEKLRKALQKHLIDEETSVMINELKDMGL